MLAAVLSQEHPVVHIGCRLFKGKEFEVQAMENGGELGVLLDHDDRMIRIEVSDTGGGIPKEDLSKIFDPFYTTKEKGTGFGLSVVLRIVKTYRGRIAVDSQIGQGSLFQLELPLA